MEFLQFIKWQRARFKKDEGIFAIVVLLEAIALIVTFYMSGDILLLISMYALLFMFSVFIYKKIQAQWACYLFEQQLVVNKLAGRQ